MEWEAPCVILDVRPFGEGDAVATVMTAEHGATRGLARGGLSRARASTWQPGNLATARWVGRLETQLGSISAELVHPAAALAMDDAMALAMLSAACALAEGALPEREAHPRVFDGLVHLIAHLSEGQRMLADQIRWEAALLADLGYGIDFSSCPVTGATEGLSYVSPRTGRAVSEAGAGAWKDRLLKLPGFMVNDPADDVGPAAWRDGLLLTGHFLERDVFGHRHRPLPPARVALFERVCDLARRSLPDAEERRP